MNAYSAQYIADFFPSDGFVTDGAGNLILADWFGTEDSAVNSDIFGVGGGVRLFNGAISAFDGELSFYEPTFGNTADWTGPTLVVPEPSTFLIGFVTCAMLLGAGRRRQIST